NKIDVSNYSKGIYFVKVQNAKEIKVGKIIIQ
ncbi:MAG: T9SS type A sorting domain-containing protein, partial [Bacteroidales bacterium]|nr:T9SS type A sorting domain-containing protein [Bacteroidales bacterium]